MLDSNNVAIQYFTNRDLLNNKVQSLDTIWNLQEVTRIIKKQKSDGYWNTKKRNNQSIQLYNLIETWKNYRFLVEKYEMNNSQDCIQKASEFIFSCQSNEGDIRGFLGNQYATYYTGAILYLLIKAGYEKDQRVEKGLNWILSMQQKNGGWVGSPILDLSWNDKNRYITKNYKTIEEWDRTKPLCLNSTGMIIRAFAIHKKYRANKDVTKAAQLLKRHFFMENYYTSYKHKDHWLAFQYPYWWNNLVSALDSISMIFPDKDDRDIKDAINWFIDNQEKDGLWKISYSKIHKNTITTATRELQLWITLVICRILKRLL